MGHLLEKGVKCMFLTLSWTENSEVKQWGCSNLSKSSLWNNYVREKLYILEAWKPCFVSPLHAHVKTHRGQGWVSDNGRKQMSINLDPIRLVLCNFRWLQAAMWNHPTAKTLQDLPQGIGSCGTDAFLWHPCFDTVSGLAIVFSSECTTGYKKTAAK